MTARISAAGARRDLADVVKRSARGERIKLTRYGRTQAVLISKGDLKQLEDCEQAPPGHGGGKGARRQKARP